MKIIEQNWSWVRKPDNPLELIEGAGRTCYKSEDKITPGSAERFARMLLKRGHESVIEHAVASVKFVTNRGVTHELVRHRLASFSQESTRYVASIGRSRFEMESEDDVIQSYRSGLSMRRISEISDGKYSEWDVYKILDKFDIERRSIGNVGHINHDFFEKIDRWEKAYLLGFIMADGSLRSGKTKQVTITQHQDYFWFIHRMVRNFIKSDPGYSAQGERKCCAVSWTSEKMWRDLVGKGVIPNKSSKFGENEAELLWNAVPESLKPDFLRGYLDGDGHVRFFRQKNPGKTFSCRFCWTGPVSLLLRISNWINKKFDYTSKVEEMPGKTWGRLCVHKPAVALGLLKLMYENFVFPYGHPLKVTHVANHISINPEIAAWGDPKFQVIKPVWFDVGDMATWVWARAMDKMEDGYSELLLLGSRPEQAREVLPNSLKTEIVVTANLREFMHIFRLRCSPKAHPQMRALMLDCLKGFHEEIPVIFDEIFEQYAGT